MTHKNPSLRHNLDLPDDLAEIFRNVPSEDFIGVSVADLRRIKEIPLVTSAIRKFRAKVVNIEVQRDAQPSTQPRKKGNTGKTEEEPFL